jgi:MoaA/NifB/PqqE/SkfB family radical SAM enzyme
VAIVDSVGGKHLTVDSEPWQPVALLGTDRRTRADTRSGTTTGDSTTVDHRRTNRRTSARKARAHQRAARARRAEHLNGESPIPRRRRRNVLWSIPHYLTEIRRIRRAREVLDWVQYKFPRYFELRSFPTALTLEITNECNFACPHCPRDELNRERDMGFMPMDVFNRIAAESAGRVAEIKIIGMGEPALHPDLDAMMTTFARHGTKIRLYTNGTLFERFTPEQILAWNLFGVVVSVDGVDERSFRHLRVGGDYEALRRNLAAFRTYRDAHRKGRGTLIEIRHVIMPNETNEKLAAFRRDWTTGLGDTVKFNLLGPTYDDRRNEDPDRPPCRDIRRELHIRWDGRIPLCGYGGDKEWIGDLRHEPLGFVWQADRLDEVRACHSAGDLSTLAMCRTCQHR